MSDFKYKIGDVVNHIDLDPSITGVIVDRGFLGQMESTEVDFDLNLKFEDDTSTGENSPEEYYQKWYRILWNDPELGDFRFETPTRKYNGQESEGILELVE